MRAETEGNVRPWIPYSLSALVLLWAVLSTLSWSGQFRNTAMAPLRGFAFGPILTTWPAHEVLLVLSGYGMGANRYSGLTLLSFAVYLAWSAVFWGPLGLLAWKRVPVWLVLTAQAALAVSTAGLFFLCGNG